eukprot:gene23291-biopygen14863
MQCASQNLSHGPSHGRTALHCTHHAGPRAPRPTAAAREAPAGGRRLGRGVPRAAPAQRHVAGVLCVPLSSDCCSVAAKTTDASAPEKIYTQPLGYAAVHSCMCWRVWWGGGLAVHPPSP